MSQPVVKSKDYQQFLVIYWHKREPGVHKGSGCTAYASTGYIPERAVAAEIL